MITINNYREVVNEDGSTFFVLELQGGLEMVQSEETGNFYATAKKASITSTFDEATCKSLVGTKMQGSIVKVEVEPYIYLVKDTGEEITLTHRWVYSISSNSQSKTEQPLVANTEVFSENGEPELAETSF